MGSWTLTQPVLNDCPRSSGLGCVPGLSWAGGHRVVMDFWQVRPSPVKLSVVPHLSSNRTHRSLNCRSLCLRGGRLRFFRNFRSAPSSRPRSVSPVRGSWGDISDRTTGPASSAGVSGSKVARGTGSTGELLILSL